MRWLSHRPQNIVRNMFRRHSKLPADMVSAKFTKKRIIRFLHHIIKPDSGTDKYFLNSRQTLQFPKQ